MTTDDVQTQDIASPPTGLASVDRHAVAACQTTSAARRAWYHDARLCWLAGCDAPPLERYDADLA